MLRMLRWSLRRLARVRGSGGGESSKYVYRRARGKGIEQAPQVEAREESSELNSMGKSSSGDGENMSGSKAGNIS